MVQTLVQNNHRYLLLRGNTYYFRYVIPQHVRCFCPYLHRVLISDLQHEVFASMCGSLYVFGRSITSLGFQDLFPGISAHSPSPV